jgi:NADPH:quinone reductase-like Zn-dependent oxidoreductase
MKAIEYKNYGTPDVFQLCEVPTPLPKKNEVLVKIHASTVTAADIMMRKGEPKIGRLYLGIWKPKRRILGFEFAGEVVEIGENVRKFKQGDRVFGGTTGLGCYAEFTCISETDVIATMPENLSYEQAAPVSGSAITVANFLIGLGKIKKGQNILIIGASGGLGTYAIQLAKHAGAHVTGVCSSTNLTMVKSLGADEVIDYTNADFTKNGEMYDLIFDTVNKSNFNVCKKSLKNEGVYLPTVISFKILLQLLFSSIFGKKKIKSSSTGLLSVKKRLAYFEEIKLLLNSGEIKTVVDKVYPINELSSAHTYVQEGHKKGNVVINIS